MKQIRSHLTSLMSLNIQGNTNTSLYTIKSQNAEYVDEVYDVGSKNLIWSS